MGIDLNWNNYIDRFLGNEYKQGKKDLILKCVNEIKIICRDNGIDYKTFLKDYFIIPVDLTGSNIPPNTRIYLTLQFESFAGDTGYNPLHYGNCAKNQYTSTNILAVYFGSNVLTYNPDGSCTTKNVLSVNPASPQITVTK